MADIRACIADNIARVRERIAIAADKSDRKPEDIKLVCVSKNFPPDMLNLALECGVACLGENRVQEFLEKHAQVCPNEWHLIGHLQTNKVKNVIGKVDMIQSVDSVHLLNEINRHSEAAGVTTKVLFQVNTSGEESKFGVSPNEINVLIERIQALKHVKACGIMTIAPLCVDKIATRLHFVNTQRLYIDMQQNKYDNIDMEYLSMGMSGDFEDAILAGSNMVRIGSSIFGSRN